ncbi:chemerin-like receptor 1 [Pelodytes ibericus]
MNLSQLFCQFSIDLHTSDELRDLNPRSDKPLAIQYSILVLSVLTCTLGFMGNTIVIVFTAFTMKTYKSKIWFLNLAIADLMYLLVLPLNAFAVLRASWPFGNDACKMHNFLSIANMYASIFIIAVLSVDRVLSVMKPIWHHKFCSRRFCYCTCAFIWAATGIISGLVIKSSHEFQFGDHAQCLLFTSDITHVSFLGDFRFNVTEADKEWCQWCCGDADSLILNLWNDILLTTRAVLVPPLVIGYIVPLCIILICNVAIAWQVRKSGTVKSSKLYCIVITAVMAFFLTRTPLVIAQIVMLISGDRMNFHLMYKAVMLLPLLSSIASVNCCLNPIIYVLVGKNAQGGFINSLRGIRERFSRSSFSGPTTYK